MKCTPLKRKTPLRSKTPLRTYKPINKVSTKQAKRMRVLAKIEPPANGLCSLCGKLPDFRGLSKHHIKHRSQGGTDDTSNIKWLCGACHSHEHLIRERI